MRILFASPERDLLFVYQKLLGMRGHEVDTAFDGVQVLEGARKKTYDAAVIDGSLPRVGIGMLTEVLKENDVYTVLLSDRENKDKCDGYLAFPFLPEELFGALRNAGIQKRLKNGGIRTSE